MLTMTVVWSSLQMDSDHPQMCNSRITPVSFCWYKRLVKQCQSSRNRAIAPLSPNTYTTPKEIHQNSGGSSSSAALRTFIVILSRFFM